MCMKELLWEKNDFNVMIFAWDIDELMLKKAKKGIYEEDDLKGISSRRLRMHFTKEDDTFQIHPDLRSMIKFEKRDLNTDKKHSGIDLILCRNVVIYFTKERKYTFYLELYDCLRNGGYFTMGLSETLIGPSKRLFNALDNRRRIYQKIEE